MAGLWRTAFDPRVSDHLIADEGEIVVDEVRRHPMAFFWPGLLLLLGVAVLALSLWTPVSFAWLPLICGALLMAIGLYRIWAAHMDRFVITNMRVFRVHGIFSQHTATMPMARILDISVHKPFLGRVLSYGHFVFESAAQDQGLRDIRYVARPDDRDLTIQRVIQRSGLRTSMHPIPAEQRSWAERRGPKRHGPVDDYADAGGIQDDGTGDDLTGRELTDKEWLLAKWSQQDSRDHRTAAPDRPAPNPGQSASGWPTFAQPDYAQWDNEAPDYPRPDYRRPDYSQPDYSESQYSQPDYTRQDRTTPAPEGTTPDRVTSDATSNPWIRDRSESQWTVNDPSRRDDDRS